MEFGANLRMRPIHARWVSAVRSKSDSSQILAQPVLPADGLNLPVRWIRRSMTFIRNRLAFLSSIVGNWVAYLQGKCMLSLLFSRG